MEWLYSTRVKADYYPEEPSEAEADKAVTVAREIVALAGGSR